MFKKIMKILLLTAVIFSPLIAGAEEIQVPTLAENAAAIAQVQKNMDVIWTLLAAFLVFFMQAGFAMVESGFTRSKNAVNIMMKNLFDFSIGTIAYWAIGFGIMFGINETGWFGTTGFFFSDWAADKDPWLYAFWMFQVVFAATAATIVSGAMAERTKFIAYLCYSFIISAVIYPVFGSWAWGSLYKGSGWLENMGFIDFAGSTVVHSVGGWCALAGAMIIGARKGKYVDGKVRAIPGHSITLAALGVFILWFGWFGFNPGSTTAANMDIGRIAVNTNLAAAAGSITALLTAYMKFGKADIGMALNGVLAGLVAITAGCANVSPASSVIIGAIAGCVVVYSVIFFDKIRIDDPVGAISVHGVCGSLGTICAGLFHEQGFSLKIVGTQFIGVAVCFLFVFSTSYLMFKAIDAVIGLRVSEEEEVEGLDFGEHGATAYPDFVETSVR